MSTHRDDLAFAPLTELTELVTSGHRTSTEIVGCYLRRIRELNPKLHAFITTYEDEAQRAAQAADQALEFDLRLGPLHGIPIAVKDIIEIKGRITTGGSQHWLDRKSPETAALVENLVRAGMIVLGKTHTVEFAMGSFGTNQHLGTPWNPWDLQTLRIPGGSSAGSGVAVAAGLAPCAIGTDTGGSVRLPASFCGIVGLKTTIGCVSCEGVLPLSPTLDTPGPMCRSVEDAALIFDILRGASRKDEATFTSLKSGVRGMKLARISGSALKGVHPDVVSAYEQSLRDFVDLGASIVESDWNCDFEETGRIVGKIISAEAYALIGNLIDNPDLPLDDDVRPRIQPGRDMLARDYLQLLQHQRETRAAFESAMKDVDALLTPTTATAAIPVKDVNQSGTTARFTRPVNLAEGCAVALPNGLTPEELPTSLQIICPANQEAHALRIGWAYENATGWHSQHPSV